MEKLMVWIFPYSAFCVVLAAILVAKGITRGKREAIIAGFAILAIGLWSGLTVIIHNHGSEMLSSMLESFAIIVGISLFFFFMTRYIPNPELKKKSRKRG